MSILPPILKSRAFPGRPFPRPSDARAAFSLTEMMVTVTLLAVIILGLVAMFDQTRKAFNGSLVQTDLLEAGRSAADLIARDLEQASAASFGNVTNFYVDTPIEYYKNGPVYQALPNTTEVRTNTLQELFFLTRNNQQWNVVGYKLDHTGTENGVGTLYRYSINNLAGIGFGVSPFYQSAYDAQTNLAYQVRYFLRAWPDVANNTNFNRIIDGVVHFRILAYGPSGVAITNKYNNTDANFATNAFPPQTGDYTPSDNSYRYEFISNAVPAFAEIELGILESRTYQKYLALLNAPNAPAAKAYLDSHAGQVHVFRQRIALRSLDPTAYP